MSAGGHDRGHTPAHTTNTLQTSLDDVPLLVSFSKSAQALFCVAVAALPHAELICVLLEVDRGSRIWLCMLINSHEERWFSANYE